MRRISNPLWLSILAIGAGIVLAVGFASIYIRYRLPDLLPKDMNDSLGAWAFGTYWAIHAPLLFILSRRFAFERNRLVTGLLVYFALGMLWATLIQALPLVLVPLLADSMNYTIRNLWQVFRSSFSSQFLPNVLVNWLVLSLSLLFSYYARYENEKLKASQLDAQLSNARLQTLKMQLHPHFLFNTLHSVSALVLKNENRDAVKMIHRLSELLRRTLEHMETHVYTLENEIEITRRYMEIESIRFHDRLSVDWDIQPEALSAEVPTLILQPLVENAMRHGVDSSLEKSRIQITARLDGHRVSLEVRDDGKDPEKVSAQADSPGIGLKNTTARLAELYGENHSFTLSRTDDNWTAAQIVIPFSIAQDQAVGEAS